MILELLTSTVPEPFGFREMLPFVSVDEISLPSTLILSTRRSVTTELVPIVTPSIVPPLISAVSATRLSMFAVPVT